MMVRLRPDIGVDVDRLVARLAAVSEFVEATQPHVPAAALQPAREVVDRAGARLALSRTHTVVALAGPTGSGKSSLFNAIVGSPASAVGVRRPVTGTTHAYIAGADRVGELMDWLAVPAQRRFVPPAIATGELDGLVLLDLPDIDSVRTAHRDEVDRVLDLADLVVWVTDPQKYADALLHQRYLRTNAHRAATTVVVLNQIDRLSAADADAATADLRALLAADGFPDVPVLTASATTAPGIDALAEVLRDAVERRVAMLQRLSGDVDAAVDACRDLIGAGSDVRSPGRDARRDLVDSLATAAGVHAVADAADRAYRQRARASTGWPLTRWVRRLRQDPLARLRLGGQRRERLAEASSRQAPALAVHAGVDLAARRLSDRYARGLPSPWPAAILTAARSRRGDLTDTLDQAVVATDLGLGRKRLWWRAVGAAQWLVTILAIAGALWLLARLLLLVLGFTQLGLPALSVDGGSIPYPTAGLVGGVLAGILISMLARPAVSLGARRARSRTIVRLTAAVADVADRDVIGPVEAVIADYESARTSLAAADRRR
jgi:GTP-binding protein EngB required for normal cell division